MPDFDDLPFDDVTRAASFAADEPDFAVLAAKGVRRRNRRRASYAGVAAVALIGTLGAVQLTGGDPDSSPEPAPEPNPTAGLVFTREDDSTFTPTKLTVECQRVEGAMLVVVSGPFTDGAAWAEPSLSADPERSEQTIAGYVGLQMPLALVRDGADLMMPDPDGRPTWRLFADDPVTDDMWGSREVASSGAVEVESARCGSVPSIVLEVDGVLGSGSSDATVSVRGRVSLQGEKPAENQAAVEIVDDPDSEFRSLAVSSDDPDIQAALWQQCRSEDDCVEKYAVAVTDDGFATRSVVDRVFDAEPLIAAAGPVFHVQSGLGPGEFLKPDGSLVGARPGPVTKPGVVVAIGSGLPLWTIFDGEHLTSMPLPDSAPDLGEITVLSDGSLVGIENGAGEPTLARSTDLGKTWTRTPIDAPAGTVILRVIDGGDGRAVIVEGSDGASSFPFIAVHRQEVAGGPLTRVRADDDPMAHLSGEAMLPDGRLLLAIEAWSDTRPGPVFVTPPGLYVSAGADGSTFEQVEVGAPYAAIDDFQPIWVGTAVTAEGVTVILRAPPGDPSPAYSSSDGGLTWQPVPGR